MVWILKAFILIFIVFYCALMAATIVDVKRDWKENFGWQITCSWRLYSNDSLQSVKLYHKADQFMIYRPEKDGTQRTEIFPVYGDLLQVDCLESAEKGIVGKCLLNLELYHAQMEDMQYSCEVSGEGPFFRIDRKEIVLPALIPPSPAVINVLEEHSTGRANLNCSSTGVPAPRLTWTISDQREPQTFSSRYWNMTSKLWHAWSILMYTSSQDQFLKVVCTPEVSVSNKSYTGLAKEYNSANSIGKLILSILYYISLIRLLECITNA
ncbi:hypothetical protein K1T71_008145 [Dendrolimus kikuchii]|uniref:Uncharacterized protein n=1 Tax=Dendrolimus kikuchii TaxID=765133 RepID=A0ACC1CWK7_9NEOP|nr:hypothetical protein K1T71_008145 [Dendrolimus kikuchii]